MKTIFSCLILFILISGFLFAEKIHTFSDLLNPSRMVMDENYIYINQDISIFIYSAKNFELIKKFGKSGEGPEEFLRFAAVTPLKDRLLINSMGKLSYYTKDGKFIRELKATGGITFVYMPLGKNYVANGISVENNIRYRTINHYDENLKKLKEIAKREDDFQPNRNSLKILNSSVQFMTFNDRLYITHGTEFKIDVYDTAVKKLFTISRDYDRVEFTEKDKQKIYEEMKANPRQRQFLDQIKKMAVFPSHYPAIANIFERDGTIYVITFKMEKTNFEFFLFDSQGKFLKTTFVPFVMKSGFTPYPLSIKDNKLYQLIENEETEEWELHVSDIR